MANLFCIFDPSVNAPLPLPLNWASLLLPAFFMPCSFWAAACRPSWAVHSLLAQVSKAMQAALGEGARPGAAAITVALFSFILASNVAGLLPYVFTPASHISVAAVLAVPLWSGPLLVSASKSPEGFLSRLVPSGTPPALVPFMVVVEVISSGIRPLTLSVRLAANLVAGHLLISLVGSSGLAGGPLWGSVSLLVAAVPLLALEVGVAAIQAYVFTLLSSLYLQETGPNEVF